MPEEFNFEEERKRVRREVEGVEVSAVTYKGEIFTGRKHFNAIDECQKKYKNIDWSQMEMGKMVRGKFINEKKSKN